VAKLTPKQARFVAEYLIDLNATQAAIRAGYSEKTARAQGSALLTNPNVASAVESRNAKRSEKLGITAERVLKEIELLAFSDVADVVDNESGTLTIKNLRDIEPGARRTIESVQESPTEFGIKRSVKLHSKVAALTLLVKHLGLEAPQKTEHTGKDGGPIETANVRYVVQVPKEEPEDGSEVA
jgi:phage terminase small subunit